MVETLVHLLWTGDNSAHEWVTYITILPSNSEQGRRLFNLTSWIAFGLCQHIRS